MATFAKQISERGIFYAKRNAAVQFGKFSELLSGPFVYENLLGGTIGRIDSSKSCITCTIVRREQPMTDLIQGYI